VILAALLVATSTLCHATPVVVSTHITDRTLDGCGGSNTENLLWHLDRADTIGGTLNGSTTRSATGKGAVVYVCDTGVMAAHDEFARDGGSAVIAGIDMVTPNCGANQNAAIAPCWSTDGSLEIFTHGTAAGSVIAGKNTGIAPDAKIVSVRIYGTEALWIKAMHAIITHAYAEGTPPFQTAIINISGGLATNPMPQFESLMRTMILGVDANGNPDPNGKKFLFVVAAGNATPFNTDGKPIQCAADYSVILSPGYLGRDTDGLVTVGGIDRMNGLWSGSCFGYAVDVLAPADDVLVASISAPNRYRYLPAELNSGTSYATPYVSGMAARMLERDPTLTPVQLEEKLKQSPSIVLGLPVPVDAPPEPQRRRALR
jgi:subtilisin family serine protease